MDFFCKNDAYWNKLETATDKMVPLALKKDAARLRMDDAEAENLIKQWGEYDFKFKF